MESKTQKMYFIKDLILIFIGCLIGSIGINMFLIHAKLLSGGVTGVALIVQYTTSFKAGYTILLINIPLFVLSYLKLDRKFTLYSVFGTLSLSTCLILTSNVAKFLEINDILLYCIYGGVICGIGFGIVFSRNGSTGGTDIITMIIRQKYSNFNIGNLGFMMNLVVVTIGALVFGLPKALYTLLSMYIQSFVLDKVIKGLNRKQLLLIITDQETEITNYIMNSLHRGVTALNAEGCYTQKTKKMLYSIVSLGQLVELKRNVKEIDPMAFISVIDVSDVTGKGFKNI